MVVRLYNGAAMGGPPGKFGSYEFQQAVRFDWHNFMLAICLAVLGVIAGETLPMLHTWGPRWGFVAAIMAPVVRAAMECLRDNRKKE